jgi:protein phosphatase
MALGLSIGKCTLLGNYRENNEDAVDVKQFPDMTVCIVADGMGGQAAGEIASKRAIDAVPAELKRTLHANISQEAAKGVIRSAIVRANQEIMAMGAHDPDLRNMGTTIVMTVWRKGSAVLYFTNVGDSRLYRVRSSKIEQLTVDHTLAQALVEGGTISAKDALKHPLRNVLWKYLGNKEVGEGPEVKVLPLQTGDQLLLCTDGLSGVVSDDKLLSFLQENADVQQCADGLGQLALDSGSRDNVSCIVIQVAETR